MRVLVFFDLPTVTDSDRRRYRQFRRHLIKSGFMMLQESVYAKLALNTTQVHQIQDEIQKIQPEKGTVQILAVTERQFSNMEILCGQCNTDLVSNDERLLIL